MYLVTVMDGLNLNSMINTYSLRKTILKVNRYNKSIKIILIIFHLKFSDRNLFSEKIENCIYLAIAQKAKLLKMYTMYL